MITFQDYSYFTSLMENKEQNIAKIVSWLNKHDAKELFDKLPERYLEDLVLALSTKDDEDHDDLLDKVIDRFFGKKSTLPKKIGKRGKELSGYDLESEQFKNSLYGRLGKKQDVVFKFFKEALKSSSASTAAKIRYVVSLSRPSNLIDIKELLKKSTAKNLLSLLGQEVDKKVASDVMKYLLDKVVSGIGPAELWLVLHVKKATLAGGKGGAGGDIDSVDGGSAVEVKGAGSGCVTPGNPNFRGKGSSAALSYLNKTLGATYKDGDLQEMCLNEQSTLRLDIEQRENSQEIVYGAFRAFYDSNSTDKDVKDFCKKIFVSKKFVSPSLFKEFHFAHAAKAYWKFKKSKGAGFESILFVDKRNANFFVVGFDGSGEPDVPSGITFGEPAMVNGRQNYADGYQNAGIGKVEKETSASGSTGKPEKTKKSTAQPAKKTVDSKVVKAEIEAEKLWASKKLFNTPEVKKARDRNDYTVGDALERFKELFASKYDGKNADKASKEALKTLMTEEKSSEIFYKVYYEESKNQKQTNNPVC